MLDGHVLLILMVAAGVAIWLLAHADDITNGKKR